MQQLRTGCTLQGGKYRIEQVLGQGGFGITYLAHQEMLDRKVCIKEFFFKEYCERDETTSQVSLGTQNNKELVERFLAKFVKEARTISQLDHPNIIRIFDVFKENNTAYYVMEYIEGPSLKELIKERGTIPEQEALGYIRCVADALDYVHQKRINHLDVKPGNIMIRRKDSRVLLIDFGLSKQFDAGGRQTSSTPVGISHGYAPIEQYKQDGMHDFTPQSDVYALGATFYKLLTGVTPPQPSDILNDGLPELPNTVSPRVRDATYKAMEIRKKDRPTSMMEFLKLLMLENKKVVAEENEITELTPQESTNTSNSIKKDVQVKGEKDQTKTKGIISKTIKYFLLILSIGIGTYIIYNKTAVNKLTKFEQLVIDAEKGDVDAQTNLGTCYLHGIAYGDPIEKNIPKGLELLENAAKQGHAMAQLTLGSCYMLGDVVEKDYTKAALLHRKAAEQGIAAAQFCVGIDYEMGFGVTKDIDEARKWYQKAAEQGYVQAKEYLEKLNKNK